MGRHAESSTPGPTRREHPAAVERPSGRRRVRVPASQALVRREAAGAVAFSGVSSSRAAAAPRSAPRRVVLPLIGFCASFAFVSASLVNPLAGAEAATATPGAAAVLTAPGQTLTVAGGAVALADRDSYGVTEYVPPAPVVVAETEEPTSAATSATKEKSASSSSSAPVAGTPDPGSAKAIAAELVAARGWGSEQYDCLVSLWQKESGWNVYAANRSSGAYGIPQALPGSKMASVGADWQTNPATQITWGLNYIGGRYSNPCGAWAHSVASNWY